MRFFKLVSLVSITALVLTILPMTASAVGHIDGTNVRDGSGVIYLLTGGQRRPFTSAGAFLSYAYNTWSSVVPASSEDLQRPVGGFVPPQDGSIMCSDRKPDSGTCYLITDGKKAGFTSEAVFKSLGFTFHKDIFYGDVSWLTPDSPIASANEAHRSGVLIDQNGTIKLVTANGLLGIPDINVFNSWGFRFTNVVRANGYDYSRGNGGTLGMRTGGVLSTIVNVTQNNQSASSGINQTVTYNSSNNSYSQTTTTSNGSSTTTTTQNNTQASQQNGGQTNTSNTSSTTSAVVSGFYVNPNSQAQQWTNNNKTSWASDAALIQKIADQPQGNWFGEWSGDIKQAVSTVVSDAASKQKTPILVAYDIPGRDCGGYSSGGANSPEHYKQWIGSFAQGIGNRAAWVILEPDAIPGADCLSAPDQMTRFDLLKYAVATLKANSQTRVYIDAGHSAWKPADATAQRLNASGISSADGFALNVSNYQKTSDLVAFGAQVSGMVGNKHFVLDTSRNGNGPTSDNQWCNPSERSLGVKPTTSTGNALVDAYLWVKLPGESDGGCNGGPGAGQFWADYAVRLAQKAGY